MAESANKEKINIYRPELRFVIPINSFHVPKKLFREFKKNKLRFQVNSNFSEVINNCSLPRIKESSTWINQIIKNTYIQLFKEGYAKSIECIENDKLVGGLYGIHMGGCFFGESMFSHINNASKLCLLVLISILKKNNFTLLDSQFYNQHLIQFGAKEITNKIYQFKLKEGLSKNCKFSTN